MIAVDPLTVPTAICGFRPGSAHRRIRRIASLVTDTQPAVAPRPLTCKKMPAPRPPHRLPVVEPHHQRVRVLRPVRDQALGLGRTAVRRTGLGPPVVGPGAVVLAPPGVLVHPPVPVHRPPRRRLHPEGERKAVQSGRRRVRPLPARGSLHEPLRAEPGPRGTGLHPVPVPQVPPGERARRRTRAGGDRGDQLSAAAGVRHALGKRPGDRATGSGCEHEQGQGGEGGDGTGAHGSDGRGRQRQRQPG